MFAHGSFGLLTLIVCVYLFYLLPWQHRLRMKKKNAENFWGIQKACHLLLSSPSPPTHMRNPAQPTFCPTAENKAMTHAHARTQNRDTHLCPILFLFSLATLISHPASL